MVLVHGDEMEILCEIQLTPYESLLYRNQHISSTTLTDGVITPPPSCHLFSVPQMFLSVTIHLRFTFVCACFYSVFYCWLMIVDTRSE